MISLQGQALERFKQTVCIQPTGRVSVVFQFEVVSMLNNQIIVKDTDLQLGRVHKLERIRSSFITI